MKIVEYMWVNIWSMLIAPAKIPEQKGSVWVGYCLQDQNKEGDIGVKQAMFTYLVKETG